MIIIYPGMVNISYSTVYYLMIYWINNVQLSTHFINLIYSSWLFGCIYVIFQWCCHNEVTTFLFLSTVYTCQPTYIYIYIHPATQSNFVTRTKVKSIIFCMSIQFWYMLVSTSHAFNYRAKGWQMGGGWYRGEHKDC